MTKHDDDDAPELTAEIMANAQRGRDVLPPEVLAQFGRGRGRPRTANPKAQINLRIDQDVVDAFKAGGPGWQTRMNEALRAAIRPERHAVRG